MALHQPGSLISSWGHASLAREAVARHQQEQGGQGSQPMPWPGRPASYKRGQSQMGTCQRDWVYRTVEQRGGQESLTKASQRTLSPSYLAYANRPRKASATSRYRGVSYLQGKGQWKAQLYWRGKRYFLGFFNSEIEAAESYNRHALLIIGPMAPINGQVGALQAIPAPLISLTKTSAATK